MIQQELIGFEKYRGEGLHFSPQTKLIRNGKGYKFYWDESTKQAFCVNSVKHKIDMAFIVYAYGNMLLPDKIGDWEADETQFSDAWNRLHGKLPKKEKAIKIPSACASCQHKKVRKNKGQACMI